MLQLLGDDRGRAKERLLQLGLRRGGERHKEVLRALAALVQEDLDVLSRHDAPSGFYAEPRQLEIAAAINRLRSARFGTC